MSTSTSSSSVHVGRCSKFVGLQLRWSRCDLDSDGVALITFTNEKKLNPLTNTMIYEMFFLYEYSLRTPEVISQGFKRTD